MNPATIELDEKYERLARYFDPSLQDDDELRKRLADYERSIVDARQRYGHCSLRSSQSAIQQAYDRALPWQREAKRRGITSSKLYDALMKMSDASLRVLWRATPKVMQADPSKATALQRVCLRRGLLDAES